jgi:hypothetical protein
VSSNRQILPTISGLIRKITISGDYTVLDKLTFEAAPTQPASVPEPSTIFGLGASGFGAFFKRKLAKVKESNKTDG